MFEISGLDFFYQPEEPIFKDLHLSIKKNTTAIIGQNGAGKTTFVKLLKGLLRPVKGQILFDGRDLADFTVAQIAENIGLVFQNPNDQIFKNRIIDEVMFGPLNIKMNKETIVQRTQEVLELVGLTGHDSVNPYDMGLSERKLIALASVLAMDTQVVILDEPTIAQDYQGKEKIKAIIRRLQKDGKMVLTITHDMDFVAECFEHVVVFAKGKMLMEGTPAAVFSCKDVLKQACLEAPHVTQLGNKLGYDEVFLNVEEFVAHIKQK